MAVPARIRIAFLVPRARMAAGSNHSQARRPAPLDYRPHSSGLGYRPPAPEASRPRTPDAGLRGFAPAPGVHGRSGRSTNIASGITGGGRSWGDRPCSATSTRGAGPSAGTVVSCAWSWACSPSVRRSRLPPGAIPWRRRLPDRGGPVPVIRESKGLVRAAGDGRQDADLSLARLQSRTATRPRMRPFCPRDDSPPARPRPAPSETRTTPSAR